MTPSQEPRDGSATASSNKVSDRNSKIGNLFPLPSALAAVPDLTAFQNLQLQNEKERQKLKLSRVDFFRDAIRVRGSCLPRITSSVLGITLWATLIYTADHFFGRRWNTSSAIVGPLSVVVGLLLVFRNSASYNRWDEARKLWATSTADAHSLARFTWVNTHVRSGKTNPITDDDVARRLEKKKRAVRLLVLFFYAMAHELRDEEGVDWPDYDEDVLPAHMRKLWQNGAIHGKRLDTGKDYEFSTLRSLPPESMGTFKGKSNVNVEDVEAGRSGEASQWAKPDGRETESAPLLRKRDKTAVRLSASEVATLRASQDLSQTPPAMGLALYALHELARYLAAARRAGFFDDIGPAGFNGANQLVSSLTTAHASLRRIREASIPVAYGIHLKQCTLFYLLALPLTLVTELGWKMIPFVTLVAVTLLGVVGISTELEIPYGDDASDHNLALFCAQFKHEVEHMMATLSDDVPVDDLCG